MIDLWMLCRGWLLPALLPEDGGEAELVAEIAAGRVRLWVGEACALATELASEGDGTCLHIWLGGGDLQGILALRPGLEAYARGLGCRSVTIDGRPGWSRVLRGHGYVRAGGELRRTLR
ncbi:hypothetical protein [Phenylobacterium sp.]|uniref:hypothetical protein n=1 Tax=Phenylobacterium sp. TaxID=1871053 RepID=UPI0027365E4F|nr:hypothetical protein [Phenylobacterium sp.]MDP3854394.1 hypothetical protein [Phenylobacterium sp.]